MNGNNGIQSIVGRVVAVGLILLIQLVVLSAPSGAMAATDCLSSPNAACGTISGSISIASSGPYRVWSRMKAPDSTSNSYWLQIDGGAGVVVGDSSGIPAGQWHWVDYQSGNASQKTTATLSVGSHTVQMTGREVGVQIDRVMFVSDQACVPSPETGGGATSGDNCAATTVTSTPSSVPPVVNNTNTEAQNKSPQTVGQSSRLLGYAGGVSAGALIALLAVGWLLHRSTMWGWRRQLGASNSRATTPVTTAVAPENAAATTDATVKATKQA
jgi:hypothetical protein